MNEPGIESDVFFFKGVRICVKNVNQFGMLCKKRITQRMLPDSSYPIACSNRIALAE
jgi:hypothetical protein